jgi:hypothetical protein
MFLELNAWDFQIIDTLIYGCTAVGALAALLYAGSYWWNRKGKE